MKQSAHIDIQLYMPTLPDYPGVSQIRHRSPALPYRWPYLPDKIVFWAFLCLSLRFGPFLAQNLKFSYSQYGEVSGAFFQVFSHWQRLFLALKWLRILIVCSSCKTSFNVLSHSHWGGHWNSRGVVKKRDSPDFRAPEFGISALIPGSLWLCFWLLFAIFPQV